MAFMEKLIFCGAMLLSAVALDASQPVRVRVTPQIAMAPADVIVYVTVEPSADNRMLKVSAEVGGLFRSSELSLQGEGSARISILHFRELPVAGRCAT